MTKAAVMVERTGGYVRVTVGTASAQLTPDAATTVVEALERCIELAQAPPKKDTVH